MAPVISSGQGIVNVVVAVFPCDLRFFTVLCVSHVSLFISVVKDQSLFTFTKETTFVL